MNASADAEFERWVAKQAAQLDAQIRLMRPGDVPEVLRLIRLHDSDDYKAAKLSLHPERFELPAHQTAHFVSLDPDKGQPVGVCGYYVDDLEARGLYWLGWTYVNPFHRGQGHGSALMKLALAAVAHMGGRKLYLTTSGLPKYAQAVGFYQRYGFVQEGRLVDYYDEGDDQLILGRRIQAAAIADQKAAHHQGPEPAQDQPPREDDGRVIFEF